LFRCIVRDSIDESVSSAAKISIAFEIGDNGPAGGWIFYDKGYYSEGWRYLEAAPSDCIDPVPYFQGFPNLIQWGETNKFLGTENKIGSGKANTLAIITGFGVFPLNKPTYAAMACYDLTITNNDFIYDDWFLPSIEELNMMYNNLESNNIGSFYDMYWSSSEGEYAGYPYYKDFKLNTQGFYGDYNPCLVRAAREF
jgi:hypothetical protein